MKYLLLLLLALPAVAEGPMPYDVMCPDEKPYCLVNRAVLKEMMRGLRTPVCSRNT